MLAGQFIEQLKGQSGKSGTESTQASGVRKARVTRSTMYGKAPFYFPELA